MQTRNKIDPLRVMDLQFKTLDDEQDLNWCLGLFANGWMRVIGIVPNIPMTKDWRWFVWFIQRWTCFFLSLGVNIFTLWSLKKVRDGADDKTSSTLLWNEWIDYVSSSFHSTSTHLCMLIFVTPNWNDLVAVINRVEYFPIGSAVVYIRVRKVAPFATIFIIFMVFQILN